jgi:hypothetical protein
MATIAVVVVAAAAAADDASDKVGAANAAGDGVCANVALP